MNPTTTILSLLTDGLAHVELANGLQHNVHAFEANITRARAYRDAANALLTGFGELHDKLIEHPDFVALRRATR